MVVKFVSVRENVISYPVCRRQTVISLPFLNQREEADMCSRTSRKAKKGRLSLCVNHARISSGLTRKDQ